MALTAPALAADAVFGSFTLDAVHSTGGERCAVMTLEDLNSGKFRFTAVRIDADGKRTHQDGIFAFDGGDHPDGTGGSLAFLRIDEHRYAVVSKGTIRSTAMRTLSADGTALTETADGVNDGEPFRATRIFTRGAGTCAP